MTPEERLGQLGLSLPPAWEPGASLEMCVRRGDLLYLSGHMGVDMSRQIAFHGRNHHHPIVHGRVGEDVDVDRARDAARGAALNLVATIKAELGELRQVGQIIKISAFVNAQSGFADVHTIADAASDLLIETFGSMGRHARDALCVGGLPGGACVAIDGLVAIGAD